MPARSRTTRLRKTALLSFAALAATIAPAGVDAQARPVEPPPPAEAGFQSLLDWLVAHSGHTAFAEGVERLLAMAQRVDELVLVADRLVPIIPDPQIASRTARRVARVAMTVRDYDLASELFETAYIASGGTDVSSLFLQAQALLQLGEIQPAEARGRSVVAAADDYELKRRAYALVARAMHQSGRVAEAERLLATLAQLDDPDLVEPETLLLRSSVLADLGGDAAAPVAQLERLHPESVATRLLRGAGVVQAPLPVALLTTPPAALGEIAATGRIVAATDGSAATGGSGSSATEIGSSRDEAPAVTAIQVGSFSDDENAHHLSEDLSELGLDAYVEKVDRDGRALSLVLVTVGRSPDDATAVLSVLQDAGYDGFLIY